MILTDKQIDHYKRHIIIPEVGEEGQRKLLDSTAILYCENVESLRPLAYYLAALGMGRIFCYLENKSKSESLFDEVVDLNNDTSIEFLSKDNTADYRIVLGSINFVKKIADELLNEKFIQTIVSVNSQWKGTLQTFDNHILFKSFINSLNISNDISNSSTVFLANALSATLCSIEAAKHCLNIGTSQKYMLVYDLFEMKFTTIEDSNNLSEILKELNSTKINQNLAKAKVLVVGAGGLGAPAAYGLAIAGVGTLGLLDLDVVEMSNLNRQVLHSFSRIGMSKAKSAEYLLKKINPIINIKTHIKELTQDNAEEIFSDYDLIIAAVDNIPTRYLINDTCIKLHKAFVEAGVLRLDGTATTIIPYEGHCYRCLYPNIDISSFTNNDNGVLGPLPGVMGFIQAAEAIKVLTEIGTTLKNKILLFNALDMDFNIIEIQRNPECLTCGDN